MITDILDAWVHHWGWLWMMVGLTGWIVVVIAADS